jgi:hypothetical protein
MSDAEMKPLEDRRAGAVPPNPYGVVGGCLARGDKPLCNFSARIVEMVQRDDGAGQERFLVIEGRLDDGSPLPPACVPAAQFSDMRWLLRCWEPKAVLYAGGSNRDHLRAAIQLLSGDTRIRTVHTHLGWQKLGAGWTYCHAAGGIGPEGMVGTVEVALPDALADFALPMPPGREALVGALRASLSMLEG